MWQRVIGYRLQYHTRSAKGRVILIHDAGGREPERTQFEVPSAVELAAIGDVLRNEEPIGFDPESGLISTGDEPVGESE